MDFFLILIFILCIVLWHAIYVYRKHKSAPPPPMTRGQRIAYVLIILGIILSVIRAFLPLSYIFFGIILNPDREGYGIGILLTFTIPLLILELFIHIIPIFYLVPTVYKSMPIYTNIVIIVVAIINLFSIYFVIDTIFTSHDDIKDAYSPLLLYTGPIFMISGAFYKLFRRHPKKTI